MKNFEKRSTLSENITIIHLFYKNMPKYAMSCKNMKFMQNMPDMQKNAFCINSGL